MSEYERDEKKKIMNRIKKLMAFTKENNCTEGEIQNAALAVKKLLEKYQLSLFDVEKGTFEETVKQIDKETEKVTLPNWMKILAHNIALALDCRLIMGRYEFEFVKYGAQPKIKFMFIGCETDAEVAVYFFDLLSIQLFKLATRTFKEELRPHNQLARYRNSFIIGASTTIRERLKKKEEETTTGKDLVVVKDNMVKEFIDNMFGFLGNKKCSTKFDEEALKKGREAGKNIPLNKGMRNGHEGQKLLRR